jgi:hypothetical protein
MAEKLRQRGQRLVESRTRRHDNHIGLVCSSTSVVDHRGDRSTRSPRTMFIADVGQGMWEEIDIGQKGANYG